MDGVWFRAEEGEDGVWTWVQDIPTGSQVALPVQPCEDSPPWQFNSSELNQKSGYLKSKLLQGVTPDGQAAEAWIAAIASFMKHIAVLTDQPELLQYQVWPIKNGLTQERPWSQQPIYGR